MFPVESDKVEVVEEPKEDKQFMKDKPHYGFEPETLDEPPMENPFEPSTDFKEDLSMKEAKPPL